MINREDQRMVKCAFNANHKMPYVRYPWHLARCPDHKFRKDSGLPIYKCPHHSLHIFLNHTALTQHLVICEAKQDKENSPTEEVVLGKRMFEENDCEEERKEFA